MSIAEIKEFIIKNIEKKGKLPQGVDLDTFNFVVTGYVDSLAIIKFVIELEEKYDIQISDEEILLPEFQTIGGLAALIGAKLS
jgi:D-alanine--poly(phosphoribitol) ligase subunit 2